MNMKNENAITAEEARRLFAYEYRFFKIRTTGRNTTYWDKKRPRWDGGQYKNRTYPCIWHHLEEAFRCGSIVPRFYMRATFDLFDPVSARPDALLSPDVVKAYDEGRDERQELRNQLKLHHQYYEQDVVIAGLDLSDIGQDEDLQECRESAVLKADNSPLFQFCMAVKIGATTIARNCHGQAICQYLMAPAAYTEAWDTILPDKFDNVVMNVQLARNW